MFTQIVPAIFLVHSMLKASRKRDLTSTQIIVFSWRGLDGVMDTIRFHLLTEMQQGSYESLGGTPRSDDSCRDRISKCPASAVEGLLEPLLAYVDSEEYQRKMISCEHRGCTFRTGKERDITRHLVTHMETKVYATANGKALAEIDIPQKHGCIDASDTVPGDMEGRVNN